MMSQVWYRPFKTAKKDKFRRIKLILMALYLLIIFGSLILNPYVIVLLSGGFRPLIRQPDFAYALQHYNYLLKYAIRNRDAPLNRTTQKMIIEGLADSFKGTLEWNNRILYTLLLVIPINVFFPLCLAFRFTRRRLHLLMATIHFFLALANGALIAAIALFYKMRTKTSGTASLLDEWVVRNITAIERDELHFSEKYQLESRLKEHPTMGTYFIPIFTVLGVTFILHILLGIFFIIRQRIGPQENAPVKLK